MKSRINTLILIALFIFCAQAFGQNRPAPANIRPLLKGLNLNSNQVPTEQELMAAGQLGGPLYATEDTRKHTNWKIQNRDFGEAIELWNRHDYQKAVVRFREHIKKHPNGLWVAEARLHIGCDATYNGRYNEAEEMFQSILTKHSRSKNSGARELVSKAKLRMGLVKFQQNNLTEAKELFRDLKTTGTDWRSRTYAGHWLHRINMVEADKLAMLKCGTQALAAIMEKDGNTMQAQQVLQLKPESLQGYSMLDLQSIATGYGYEFAARKINVSDLNKIPLPAILQISGHSAGASGHYWVLEKVDRNELEIFDPQAERRFHQKPVELASQWDGAILVKQNRKQPLPGIALNKNNLEQLFGGCCGVPRPEQPLGSPCGSADDVGPGQVCDNGAGGDNDCGKGSPAWQVNMINMNFYMHDTPIWYQPAFGPSVSISLHYNSQSAIANYEPFGNKWQYNYATYLVKDTGGNVTVFMPDGRRDVFTPNGQGGYNPSYRIRNTLTRLAENSYELRFPDNTVFAYNIPVGTGSQQPFLVQIRDAYGQSLNFGYNANVQLTTITDAGGKVTSLSYNAQGLVQSVTDPSSRQALFEYDANKNLTKITDMAGYWTKLTYDANVYLTSLENAKGKTLFFIEPADGIGNGSNFYPGPSDKMWANYRITVTYPDNAKEEFFYCGGDGHSWHVQPKYYITWQSPLVNNYRINTPKTSYYFTTVAGQRGEISRIVYPDNSYVQHQFNSTTGNRTSSTNNLNITTQYTYNSMSLVTGVTNPQGQSTSYTYAPNNVDLIRVQNSLGSVVMTYNDKHQVTSVTDPLNRTSGFTYNSHGQITSATDASNVLTEYVYDTDHFLQQIKRDNRIVSGFTRDTIGRATSTVDANGTMLIYEYNNLNQVKKIIYPDNKYVFYTYTGCCPWTLESVTDRNGRMTYYEYDSRKNLISVTGSGTAGTRFVYDANRNMTQLIDANNNVTRFEYDAGNRLIRKIFRDNTGIEYRYDAGGRLTQRIDARNVTTNYLYDAYSNLININYSDGTPSVTYQYDNFNRLTHMTDGLGTTQYTYDNLSRVLSVDGPWVNDTLTYGYDTLDRMSGVTPQMGQAVSYGYDNLNRLTNITAGTDNFTYAYKTNTAGLVQTLTRPNNGNTTYGYDNLNRLLSIANKNSGNNVINGNTFIYDTNNDLIGSETATNNDALSGFQQGLKTYDYNNLNQLLQITPNPQPPIPSPFSYDANGNMTKGYTPQGYEFTAAYDAENRLKSIQYTDGAGVVHRAEYIYGANGFVGIIKKYDNGTLVNETRMIRDGFLELQERDQNNTVTREYVWGMNLGGGIGGLLALRQNGQNYSYLYDGKGNVSAVLDAAQQIVASYRYDTFGKVMTKSGTLDQPFQFSTKYYDQNTGLNYYGYRFYSAALGRWINRDPLGEAGGINLYGFVGNDPVNAIDLFGLDWMEFTGQSLNLYGGSLGDRSNLKRSCAAASGMPGFQNSSNQNRSGAGPIPAGGYTLDLGPDPNRTANADPNTGDLVPSLQGGIEQIPSQYTTRNGSTYIYPGWGTWRGAIKRKPGTNTFGRGSFYIHNSHKGYTHGCIETCDDLLNDLLNYRNSGHPFIDVQVLY